MNKVLIKLYVPLIDGTYDIWLPLNKKISNVVVLLVKAVNDFSGGYYSPIFIPSLYDKISGREYELNMTIKEAGILNGAELILL